MTAGVGRPVGQCVFYPGSGGLGRCVVYTNTANNCFFILFVPTCGCSIKSYNYVTICVLIEISFNNFHAEGFAIKPKCIYMLY